MSKRISRSFIWTAALLGMAQAGMAAVSPAACTDCLTAKMSGAVTATISPSRNIDSTSAAAAGYFAVSVTSSTVPNLPVASAYLAWCVDRHSDPVSSSGPSAAVSSTTLGTVYSQINYVLNHKQGVIRDVQKTIWALRGTLDPTPAPAGDGPLSAISVQMYNDAIAFGSNFVPGPGQIVGVLLDPDEAPGTPAFQNVLIEVVNPCGLIGDFVWQDSNNDGVQAPGEPGINGVTVKLLNGGGSVIATTVTGVSPAGSNGYYQFNGLCTAGALYQVAIDTSPLANPSLSGLVSSPLLGTPDTTRDSNANPALVSLPAPAADLTIDFGFYRPLPPLTIPCASASATRGQYYSSAIAVTGGLAPYTYAITAGALPPGLFLNSNTGAITGTPTTAGSYGYTVTVTDSSGVPAGTAASTCTIKVNEPLILACASQSGAVGVPYNSAVAASGGSGTFSNYAVTSGALPDGVTLNPVSGVISGTPTTAGAFNYTVTVTDSNGVKASSSCSITISAEPAAVCGASTAIMGVAYSSGIGASGGSGSYTSFLLTTGTLPPGLLLNASLGAIAGTPSATGTFGYAVKVTDTNGASATAVCSTTVSTPPPPPVSLECGTCGVDKARVGVPFSAHLNVSGGTAPFIYTIASGSLPPGLTLDPATGIVSGTPTTPGVFTFSSKATDSAGNSDTATCTMEVLPPPLELQCGTCASGSPTVGMPYSAVLAATGGAAPFTFSVVSGTLPPGLVLNPATGAVTGTPTTAGSFTITFKVADSSGNFDTATCTVTVRNPPIELQCGTCGSKRAQLGAAYSASLAVTGGAPGYTYSIVSGSLPPGLTLNPATGQISGTPSTAGTYTFTSKVVDSQGATDTATCTIKVEGPPVNLECGTCGSSAGKVGSSYSSTLALSGGQAPFAFTIVSGSLPAGLTLNSSTGVISGYPSASGSYTFTARVVDANGDSDTTTCTIVVYGSSVNVDCGPCKIGKATLGASYTAQMTVTGGSGPYTWTIVSGSLPAGLSMSSSTGKITGTPTSAGTYNFTVKAVDKNGNADTDICQIVVQGNSLDIQCGSCGTGNGTVGTPYSAAFAVTGASGTKTFSIVSGSLPPGISLNSSTGALSGTPAASGSYTFTAKVVSGGSSDTVTCTIVIASVPLDLGCGACGGSKAHVGMAWSSALSATGGSPNYTYSISSGSLPPGLTLNPSTGMISGTPSTAGTYTFTSKVVDSKGKSDTATCSIYVAPPPIVLSCGPCSASKGYLNQSYSATMTVSGGTGPFTYSIQSGSLPPGLSLNTATGKIGGTPTLAGTYTFTSRVVDSKGNVDTDTCTITVAAPKIQLTCGSCGSGKAYLNVDYTSTMSVSGGSGSYTFSIASGSLPPGLTLSPTTGKISGKATAAGSYTFTTRALDSNGGSDTATCTLVVSSSLAAGQYTTYTQGGWGSNPSGNNPGALLASKFSTVYPGGSVAIGGSHKLTFTSASAIASFLPQGGTAAKLASSSVNPYNSPAGVFAGQVLALQLSVDFSTRGITQPGLGALRIKSGALAGQTVAQVLALANTVLGGSTSALPGGWNIADLNSLIDNINNNFDNGNTNKGYLY